MSKVLERLGPWSDADRAWMFEYRPDLSTIRNTHEWCRDGVSSHVADLQNTPVTLIGEAQTHMLAGGAVMIADVTYMPPSMRSLQLELLRQGIKSTLAVPVHHGGRLRAAIGLDATRERRDWDGEVAAAMLMIAGLIGKACFAVRPNAPPADPVRFKPFIYVRTGRSIRGAPLDGIVMLRADGDQSVVSLGDGTTLVDIRPLKWWCSVLPPDRFLRLSRSAIVQVRCIASLTRTANGPWRAEIDGPRGPVTVSRKVLPQLRSRLGV
ncbi:hypothetical protein BH23PSE1_BH23PSE1_06130 [soil metagenome]